MGKDFFVAAGLALAAFAPIPAAQAPVTQDVAGVVTGHGGERVRVTVWHDDMGRVSMNMAAEGFADEAGTFRFEALPWFRRQQWGRNQYVVVARTASKVALHSLRGDDCGPDTLRIALRDTVDLRGRLLAETTRAPVKNGWIWPSILKGEREVWVTRPLLPWRAETDEEGRFVLRGLPAGVTIKALAGGRDHARTWIDVPDTGAPFDVALPAGGRITGRVLMPDGTPAARVQVETTGSNAGRGHTLTDDDGRFELSALGVGTYKVWAEVPDLTCVAATRLEVRENEVVEDQVVQLVEGGFIVGRIVDKATGKPFVPGPQTDVAMYGPARGDGGSCQCTPVKPDGTFRIRAPAGRNRIYLRAARGYREPTEFVEVVEGRETEVTWEVDRPKAPPGRGR